MQRISTDAMKALQQQDQHYNRQVDDNLRQLNALLDQADSAPGLLAALRDLGEHCMLEYRNRFFNRMLILFLLVAAASTGLAYWLAESFASNWPMALLLAPAAMFFWVMAQHRSDKDRQQLVTRARDLYEQLKYGFSNQASQDGIEHQDILGAFAHAFKRGNHSNDIPRHASGRLPDTARSLPYTIFNYHYVNERRETYYENNRRKERIVYDHFDRWGIFLADMPAAGVALTSSSNRVYPMRWDTSSIAFNRRHHITGTSEIELARLFQPVNILMFEQLLADEKEFDLQFSSRLPVLYWGFNRDLFKRNGTTTDAANAHQLAGLLDAQRLPNFEHLLHKLQPLINTMVK